MRNLVLGESEVLPRLAQSLGELGPLGCRVALFSLCPCVYVGTLLYVDRSVGAVDVFILSLVIAFCVFACVVYARRMRRYVNATPTIGERLGSGAHREEPDPSP